MDPGGGECLFCGQTETLAHLFVQCSRLSALFGLLKTLFWGLGEGFSLSLFISGLKHCAKKKNAHTLINFLSDSVKLAIWLKGKNRAQNTNSVEPVPVLGAPAEGQTEGAACLLQNDGQQGGFLWERDNWEGSVLRGGAWRVLNICRNDYCVLFVI